MRRAVVTVSRGISERAVHPSVPACSVDKTGSRDWVDSEPIVEIYIFNLSPSVVRGRTRTTLCNRSVFFLRVFFLFFIFAERQISVVYARLSCANRLVSPLRRRRVLSARGGRNNNIVIIVLHNYMDHSTHVKPSKIHIFWEAYLKCNTIVKNALKNDFVSNVVAYF